MAAYPEKLQAVLDELAMFPDKNDKISLLIDYAGKYERVPESIAKPPFPGKHKVEYCESEAYVWVTTNNDGTVKLYFAVENPQGISAKALAGILDRSLSGLTPGEIKDIDSEVVYDIFGKELSMGKSMGLTGIVKKVQYEVSKLN